MVSRMDKYRSNIQPIQSRSQRNEHLYEELYTNKVFTEFTDVENNNAIDISNVPSYSTKERRIDFQKNKAFYDENDNSRKKTALEKKYAMEDTYDLIDKNYNINDVLENAKKNRTTVDELEKKRHLKNVEYDILSDLSQEKLKEYQEKKQKLSQAEEENLEELIHTITSNSLRQKIDDELLSDLMPSSKDETIVSSKLLKEVEDIENQEELDDTTKQEIDHSFYTQSMDLSEEDFECEDNSFIEETKSSFVKKIFIILFILIVILIIGYVMYYFI